MRRRKKEEKLELDSSAPKIKKKLDKNSDLAALYTPKPARARVFKVGSSPKTIYIVELNLRSCTCKRWQLTCIPCAHAIACLRHERSSQRSWLLIVI
jgi:hypothetical protein